MMQEIAMKLEAAEMRMLQFECGIIKMDKMRNEVIRNILKVEQLGAKMRKGQLR